MKTTLILTAALIGGLALPATVFAGPFGLPDHQPDGYRDTGCDPAKQVQITNSAGKYLYSNNPTCPMKSGTVGWVAPGTGTTPGDGGEGPGDDDTAGDDTGTTPDTQAPIQTTRPGHGHGDKNHDHKGPPGKKS